MKEYMLYLTNTSNHNSLITKDADGRIIEKWCFWNWDIQNCNSGDVLQDGDDIEYESYELAAIAGIEYCLNNLI